MPVKLVRSRSGRAEEYPRPGDVLAGKYRIERVIGEGGMGVVFAAHHELLDQAVAVKLLFAEAGRDEEAVGRFLQEARSAAKLQSEHVTRVMDIDTLPSGLPFIVMEYLEGSDLSDVIDNHGPQAPMFAVDCVLQALEALSLAHAQGIVHRDLKPSNLFLTKRPDGSQIVKILDFGISKTHGSKRKVQTLTTSRSVLGSPPYMSPEQVRSPRSVDSRTDIWSMGVVLYELLTAKMPFAGEEVGETFAAILEKAPDPVRKLNPRVPEGLEAAVAGCLQRDREKRFASVADMAAAIAPFGSGKNTQSLERIRQTLARTDELSNPRGVAVSSGSMAAARPDAQTVDVGGEVDASGVDAREELSPTASTVRRDRFTLFGRTARELTLPGLVALATSIAVMALVGALWWRSQRPVPSAGISKPPPATEEIAPAAASATAAPPAGAAGGSPAVPVVTPSPPANANAGAGTLAQATADAPVSPPTAKKPAAASPKAGAKAPPPPPPPRPTTARTSPPTPPTAVPTKDPLLSNGPQ
jgi:serine/threonine-protein kinase